MIRFRGDIEGLRAVAVFLVIFDHLAIRGFHGGFIGVDVFFVISGYLITSLLAAEYAEKAAASGGLGSISIGHFYLRRARRILPAALTVIAAVVIASHLLLNTLRVQQVQHDALWATFFGSNLNFIRQASDYFAAGFATSSPFRHYWSLAVEEQFYFVWPLLFLLVTGCHGLAIRERRIGWRLRLGIALASVGVASLIWSITDTANNAASAYFSTFTRAWELALGALIGIATTRATAIGYRRATAASVTGVALLLAGCIVIGANSAFPGYVALLPTLGAGLLIVGGISDTLPVPNRILSLAPMRFFGRISYSLYLWHWPLIVFAAALYPHASTRLPTRAAILALMIVISIASFYAVERPFRRMAYRRTGQLTNTIRLVMGRRRRGLRKLRDAAAMLALAGLVVGTIVSARNYDHAHAGVVEVRDANGARPTAAATQVRQHNVVPKRRPKRVAHRAAASGAAAYDKLLARWDAKLRAAIAQRTLPATLQPLQQHLSNVAAPCAGFRLAIVAHENECAWGNPNAPHVAAITGDSHAGMWLSTLEGALNPRTWVLYPFTRSWCGWSGGSENIAAADAPKNKDCANLQAQTLEQLKKLHVDLVVLSESGVRPPTEMTAALQGFATLATHVVVLGHTPVVVPNFASCLHGTADISSCQGWLSSKDLATVDLERNLALQFGDPFIDTTGWFCVDLICPPVIDGAPVFADGSHISAELAPKLVPLLRQGLRESGALPAQP